MEKIKAQRQPIYALSGISKNLITSSDWECIGVFIENWQNHYDICESILGLGILVYSSAAIWGTPVVGSLSWVVTGIAYFACIVGANSDVVACLAMYPFPK